MGEPYAFIQKKVVPLAEAKIGVMTHAFNYGTACFDTRTFNILWQRRDLLVNHSVGPGSSPVLSPLCRWV